MFASLNVVDVDAVRRSIDGFGASIRDVYGRAGDNFYARAGIPLIMAVVVDRDDAAEFDADALRNTWIVPVSLFVIVVSPRPRVCPRR